MQWSALAQECDEEAARILVVRQQARAAIEAHRSSLLFRGRPQRRQRIRHADRDRIFKGVVPTQAHALFLHGGGSVIFVRLNAGVARINVVRVDVVRHAPRVQPSTPLERWEHVGRPSGEAHRARRHRLSPRQEGGDHCL